MTAEKTTIPGRSAEAPTSHPAPALPAQPGFPLGFRLLVVALASACLLLLPAGLQDAVEAPWVALFWVALTGGANLVTIPMLPRVQLDTSLGAPISVAAAVLLPAPLTVLVTLLGFTNEREIRRQSHGWMVVFNRSQAALSAGAASGVAHLVISGERPAALVLATVVAVPVFNIVNTVFVTMAVRLRRRVELTEAARGLSSPVPRFAVDFTFIILLAAVIVLLAEAVGLWAVGLVALPMWLGYSALRSARESEDRAEELATRVRELETLNALGSELLTARQVDQVAAIGQAALQKVLPTEAVDVALAGSPVQIGVKGAEGGAVGMPADIDERSLAVVEAVAGLTRMALQRVELEQELAANEKALSKLSAQILEEGTHERSRVALRIHDDVLPSLAAAQMQSDNVRTALARDEVARAAELAMATQQAVHDGIARLREALDALRSQILVPGRLRQGLMEALSELRLTTGVTATLDAPDPLPPLPLAVEILVLETVRGCLANVAHHAAASSVQVRINMGGSMLDVQVADDGRGFDPACIEASHHGLDLMARRVELTRGRFTVDSAPGHGTTVKVTVPA